MSEYQRRCKKRKEEEMNCPDDDFIFQQQKIVFRRLRFFFLSFSRFFFLYFFSSNFFSFMSVVFKTYETILDETAHQRRDDAFSFSLSFFSRLKIKPQAKKCEGEREVKRRISSRILHTYTNNNLSSVTNVDDYHSCSFITNL
jgi:hypothetical protein